MSNIILIFVYLLLGVALQYVKWFPTNSYKLINKFVINVCLPALALYYIPKIQWDNKLLYLIGVAWIGFAISFFLFRFIGKKYGWSKKLIGCLIITAGLGNTSFLGFPIVNALYGSEGLKMAILVDQPGTFVLVSTLAIVVATMYSKDEISGGTIIKKVMLFPPFVCFLVSCVANILNLDFHDYIQFGLTKLGSLLTPLAIISVGLQLHFDSRSQHWKFLWIGLAYKLFIMPAILFVLYVFALKQSGLMIQVALIEAAMAPMIMASIVATSHGLKPRLSSMMIGFGIPISFVTLAFWYFVLQFLG
nr:AEC family transporter [uncultured Flavobacterium sp.]